jgi:hypothetical protein
MPIVPVQTWALPDNEVDCLPGGFLYDDELGTIERGARSTPTVEFSDDGVPDDYPTPKPGWKKRDIKEWLDFQGVDEADYEGMTKAQLLDFADSLEH